MNQYNQDNNSNIQFIESIYIPLLGLYSNKYSGIDSIEPGSTVGIFQDASNQDRAIRMLEDADLITVKDTGDELKSLLDITENPLNLEFVTLDINQTTISLDDLDLAFIFSQHMIQADVQAENQLAMENPNESLKENFANGLTVREEDVDSQVNKDIIAAFQTEETKANIEKEFGESVLIVTGN